MTISLSSAPVGIDIIAVERDVLRHVALLQDVDLVIKHGQRVK